MNWNSFLFFVFCLALTPVQSQEQDSLRQQYVEQYYNVVQPDSLNDLLSGAQFFKAQLENSIGRRDTAKAIYESRLVAQALFGLGVYNECEEVAIRALEWAHQLPRDTTNLDAISSLNNRLGMVYREHGQYDRAITYYQRATEAAISFRDSVVYTNNIALVYRDRGDSQKALQLLEEAYQRSLETTDSVTMARTLDNLGYVQSLMGITEGEKNLQAALDLRISIEDIAGSYASFYHLSEHYLRAADTAEAGRYADKALEVAFALNNPANIQDALARSLKINSDARTREYIRISDSIYRDQKDIGNKYAALRYDAVTAEARAREGELEAERQKRSKLIYQATGGLLVLSAIFLFILLRNRHRRDKVRQVSQTEARISKKVHDEVANDIHLLLTQLEASGRVDEVFLHRLDEVYNRTRNISKEVAGVDPDTDFGLQLAGLLKTYRSEEVQVITRNLDKIDWEHFDLLKKNTLYRVIQELMTNMRKHSRASVVALIFEQEGKRLSVSYRDNGVGAQLEDKGGLQNTENRMEAVGGTISFETEPGKGFNAKLVL